MTNTTTVTYLFFVLQPNNDLHLRHFMTDRNKQYGTPVHLIDFKSSLVCDKKIWRINNDPFICIVHHTPAQLADDLWCYPHTYTSSSLMPQTGSSINSIITAVVIMYLKVLSMIRKPPSQWNRSRSEWRAVLQIIAIRGNKNQQQLFVL